MNRIFELEKKVSQCKEELNNLIIEYENEKNLDKKIINYRINELKKEIGSLSIQINMLQQTVLHSNKQNNKQPIINKPINITTKEPIENVSNYFEKQKVKPIKISNLKSNINSNDKTMENMVGKTIMGICASILIFISIVSLSMIMLPMLTDEIKIFLMFAISFAFTITGHLLNKKDNKNKLYLSLLGCGFGSIYISLIVSHIYFNLFNQYILYLFIIAWIIILNLMNSNSKIFNIIAQIGISISILFGMIQFITSDDITRYFIILYAIITELIMLFKNFKKEYESSYIDNIFNMINLSVISLFLYVLNIINDIPYTIISILVMISCLISIGYNLYKIKTTDSKQNEIFLLISSIIYFISMFLSINCFSEIVLFTIFINIFILLFIENKFKSEKFNIKKRKFLYILVYICLFNILICSIQVINCFYSPLSNYTLHILTKFILLPALIICFSTLGFFKKRTNYKIFSFIFLIYYFSEYCFSHFGYNIVVLMLLSYMIYLMINKHQYSQKMKNTIYVCLFYTIINMIATIGDLFIIENISIFDSIIFITASIIHISYFLSKYSKNWFTKEPEKYTTIVLNIINSILMIVGISFILNASNLIYSFIYIIITFALFSLNAKNILEKYGIYVGIKYTILLYVILCSFDSSSLIISIALLIFAILAILYGFNKDYKALRGYGLGLSLFSIIKLVLFDITYNDTISKSISYLICGLLCFIISMIYNNFNKRKN